MNRRLLAAILAWVATTACDPKAGRRCTTGQAACTGATSGLACGPDGLYRTVSCAGRLGCRQRGAMVSCDQSLASAGDTCTGRGFACAEDLRSALACQGGTFTTVATCYGPRRCGSVSGEIACDHDVAAEGDLCKDDGDLACSVDKGSMLRCTETHMVVTSRCPGPRGCSIVHPRPGSSTVSCDVDEP